MKDAAKTPSGFPVNAFTGTADDYIRYRLPYPDALISSLWSECGIRRGGRLLDLACGPGRLTFALADRFEEALALDLEPEMIEAGLRESARRGVRTIQWLVGSAEQFDAPAATFDLISMGDAFHRLDQPVVAAKALTWLKPGCCIAIFGSYSILGGREPWQVLILETLARFSGKTAAKAASPTPPVNRGDPRVHALELQHAGYLDVATHSLDQRQEWTLEAIQGFLRSTSVASRSVMGSKADSFEAEIAKVLLAYDPRGSYSETIRWGYTLGRKPA